MNAGPISQIQPIPSGDRSVGENVTTWYGKTANSQIADPADPKRIFRWLICETNDDKGNLLVHEYKAETSEGVSQSLAHESNRTEATRAANRYLKRIKYGNRKPYFPTLNATDPWPAQPTEWLFETVFDYGEHDSEIPAPEESTTWPARIDPFSSYRAGFEVRTYRLCQRVLMFHRFEELGATPCLVRSTDFSYSSDNQTFSFVSTATQSGYKRRADGSYLKKAMPPVEFEYSQPIRDEQIHEVDSESLENLPSGIDERNYRLVDLDGEGAAGILTDQGGAWFYKRNISLAPGEQPPTARFGPAELVAQKPSLAAVGAGRSPIDGSFG